MKLRILLFILIISYLQSCGVRAKQYADIEPIATRIDATTFNKGVYGIETGMLVYKRRPSDNQRLIVYIDKFGQREAAITHNKLKIGNTSFDIATRTVFVNNLLYTFNDKEQSGTVMPYNGKQSQLSYHFNPTEGENGSDEWKAENSVQFLSLPCRVYSRIDCDGHRCRVYVWHNIVLSKWVDGQLVMEVERFAGNIQIPESVFDLPEDYDMYYYPSNTLEISID